MAWRLHLILPVVFFALSVLACDQKPVDLAPETPTGQWRSHLKIDDRSHDVYAVWTTGPTDVWIASNDGVEHFDGSAWSDPAPQIDPAFDVWGSGSEVYVTSGMNGLWHFDGMGWEQINIPSGSIDGTGPANVFVRYDSDVVHFDGVAWDTILTADNVPYSLVYSVAALPAGGCVATTSDDSVMIWDGDSWTTSQAPGLIQAIWPVSQETWIAVGRSEGGDRVWLRDTIGWHVLFTPEGPAFLNSVWASGEEDIYAAGYDGLFHFDGLEWKDLRAVTTAPMSGLSGTSSSNVYVVGDGGRVLQWDGTSWRSLHSVEPGRASVLWAASPEHLFLAGVDGVIYEFVDGAWVEWVMPGSDPYYGERIYSLSGSSPDNVFAALGQRVMRFDGSTWSTSIDSLSFDGTSSIADVHALPSGRVFTAGSGGYVFDGATWSRTYEGDLQTYKVWALGENCAYAVGHGVLHFDGSVWKTVNSTLDGYDVWAASCDDVYVAHGAGIMHFDGTRWKSIEPYPTGVVYIAGGSTGEILAVYGGTTLQYDRGFWRIENSNRQFLAIETALNGVILGLGYANSFEILRWEASP